MQKTAFIIVGLLAAAIVVMVLRMQSSDETLVPVVATSTESHEGHDQETGLTAHPPPTSVPVASFDLSDITVPEGGHSIATLYSEKSKLDGQRVIVRGKVVKFTERVMDKNWIHIQDGTGNEGTSDLTITTGATVAIGDVVVVEGILGVDKDFGFGYEYEIIVEEATVTTE